MLIVGYFHLKKMIGYKQAVFCWFLTAGSFSGLLLGVAGFWLLLCFLFFLFAEGVVFDCCLLFLCSPLSLYSCLAPLLESFLGPCVIHKKKKKGYKQLIL